MPIWSVVLIQVLVTVVAVMVAMSLFWGLVVRPWLERKVAELVEASRDIEPGVTRGVKKAVSETLRELPESALDVTVRESTRQFLKFGSGLFENGLSSFLGGGADTGHRSQEGRRDSGKD